MTLVIEEAKTQRKEALRGPVMTVGRDPSCDIVINDASVSRRHCTFFEDQTGWSVEDNGSRNGTEVAGRRITARTRISAGSALKIGTLDWSVAKGGSAPATKRTTEPKTTVFSIEDLMQKNAERGGKSLEKTLSQVLFNAQQALYPGQPIESLLDSLLRLVLEYTPAGRASVQLVNQETQDVEPALTLDHLGEAIAPSKDFLMSQAVREKVLSERKCVLIADVRGDEAFNARKSLVGAGITSAVAAPIFDGGDVLGILYADIRNGMHELHEDEATVISLLASFGGTMLNAANMVTALMQSEAALREENLALRAELDARSES